MTNEGKKSAPRPAKGNSTNSIKTQGDVEPKQTPIHITNSASKASANDLSQDNPMKSILYHGDI